MGKYEVDIEVDGNPYTIDVEAPTEQEALSFVEKNRVPLRAQISPKAGRAAGYPGQMPKEAGLSQFADVGKAIVSPDVLVPTAAGIGGFAAGGPPVAIGAATIAGGLMETAKIRKEKGKARSFLEAATPPPFNVFVSALQTSATPEEAKRVLTNSIFEGAVEALGFGAARVLGKAKTFSPFKSSVNPEVLRLESEFPNLQFNLAQKTDNFLADKMEGIARAGYLSRDRMLRMDRANADEMRTISKRLANEFYEGLEDNLSPEQIGTLLNESMDFGRAAQKSISNKLYAEVDALVSGVPVEKYTTPTSARTRSLVHPVTKREIAHGVDPYTGVPISKEELTGGITARRVSSELLDPVTPERFIDFEGAAVVPTRSMKDYAIKELQESSKIADLDISSKIRRILTRFQKLDDGINFRSAHRMRSYLIDLRRSTDLEPGMDRIARNAIKIVDESMEKAATNLSPEANRAWRRANSFYRGGIETFETELLSKLFVEEKKLASEIGMSIYKSGTIGPKGAVERVRELKKAVRRASILAPKKVGYDETMSVAKRGYFEGLLNKHWKANPDLPGGGEVNFMSVLNDISRADNKAIMKELYSPDELRRINDVLQAGITTQRVAPQAGSALGIVQTSAVFGSPLTMLYSPVAGSIQLGAALGFPHVVAQIITNKRAVNFLTKGFQEFSKGTKQSIARSIQFAIRAGREVLDKESAETIRDKFDLESKFNLQD